MPPGQLDLPPAGFRVAGDAASELPPAPTDVIACVASARTAVRTYGCAPISLRITGRTNTSKETNELTGLPGSMIIGSRSAPISPNPCGFPAASQPRRSRRRRSPASPP